MCPRMQTNVLRCRIQPRNFTTQFFFFTWRAYTFKSNPTCEGEIRIQNLGVTEGREKVCLVGTHLNRTNFKFKYLGENLILPRVLQIRGGAVAW